MFVERNIIHPVAPRLFSVSGKALAAGRKTGG